MIVGKSAEAKERRLVPEVVEDFFLLLLQAAVALLELLNQNAVFAAFRFALLLPRFALVGT